MSRGLKLFSDEGTPNAGRRGLFPGGQVAVLVAAAVLLRAVYWSIASDAVFFRAPIIDASQFDIWARTLVDGGIFQPGPFFKPPLYPYLLAMIYRTGLTMAAVQILQMAVGVVTVLLTLVCGRLSFAPRPAFFAALAVALLPILPFFETQLLAETWTTALIMGAVVLLLLVVTDRTRRPGRTLAVAGLLLGIAALGRPNLMLLVAVAAVWLWRWGKRQRKLTLGGVAVLVVGFVVGISPATLHNLRHGEFVPISTNLGANLVVGNRDAADGVAAIPVGVRWDELQLSTRQAGVTTAGGASRNLTGVAVAWIKDNPGRFLQLLGKKIVLLVNAQEGRNNINPRWLAANDGVFLLGRWWPGTWLLLPPALLGLAVAGRGQAAPGLLRWLLFAQAVVLLPFFVNARFRAPMLPFAALFATAGVAVLWSWRVASDRRQFFLGLGALLLAIVVVNVDWFGLGHERWLARDYYNLAMVSQQDRQGRAPDLNRAEQAFRRAGELDPQDPDYPEGHGVMLLQQAQPLLERARGRIEGGNPAAAATLYGQAQALLNRAAAQHARASQLFPRSFRSWANLGVCHLWSGEADAFAANQALTTGDRRRARGLALQALESYELAVDAFQASLRVDPTFAIAGQSLSQVWPEVMALPELDPRITEVQDGLRRRGVVGPDEGQRR